MSGYPPGTPDALTEPSRTGVLHNLAAVPVFLGLPAAAFTCSGQSVRTGHRGFGRYCAATATTMLATTVLASAGFSQSPRLVNLAGLFQRASIVTGLGWLTALSAHALHPLAHRISPPAASLKRPARIGPPGSGRGGTGCFAVPGPQGAGQPFEVRHGHGERRVAAAAKR